MLPSDGTEVAAQAGAGRTDVGDAGLVDEPVPSRFESPRKRRQLFRLAHIVGYSTLDLRAGTFDAAKMNNVERMLSTRLDSRRLALKRAVDVFGSAFALLLLLPLLTLTALAVWVSSPGPVIFSQLRYGLNGRPFRVYKFRTLFADRTDASGVLQTEPGDRRITPVGRWIRRANIDELPQLWNVLIGNMSLVGPRPHPIGMRAGGMKYEDLVLAYPLRTMIKPGITGLAQVEGYRGPTKNRTSARMRIVCDLAYISSFSMSGDLGIALLTLWREFRGGSGT